MDGHVNFSQHESITWRMSTLRSTRVILSSSYSFIDRTCLSPKREIIFWTVSWMSLCWLRLRRMWRTLSQNTRHHILARAIIFHYLAFSLIIREYSVNIHFDIFLIFFLSTKNIKTLYKITSYTRVFIHAREKKVWDKKNIKKFFKYLIKNNN